LNNIEFNEIKTKFHKDEVSNNFRIDISNLKIFKLSEKIISNTNEIILVRKNLEIVNKNIDINNSRLNQNKNYNLKISYEKSFEIEIKELIKEKCDNILVLFKILYEWFCHYFDNLPEKSNLGICILKNLNKQISSSNSNIVIDISNLNPENDVIEKNYFNFLFINQM